MDLREALGGLTTDGGLSLALVTGRDGLLIESQSTDSEFNAEQLAALAAASVHELERIGRALGTASPTRIRLQFDRQELLIEPLTDTDLLVAGAQGEDCDERLAEAVARHRAGILEALNDF